MCYSGTEYQVKKLAGHIIASLLFNRNDIERNKNAIGGNSALLHEESLNGTYICSYLCLRRQ